MKDSPKIISGGQTGADRAALDWAIENGFEHGGWCPLGRKAEDGVIDARYQVHETPSEDYLQRTEWNVRDSDGTVIFTLASMLTDGSKVTAESARKSGKPLLHISKFETANPSEELRRFIAGNEIMVLNVAGPRASKEPGIAEFVKATLSQALTSHGPA